MNLNIDPDWLREAAEKERNGIVSVGGLVCAASVERRDPVNMTPEQILTLPPGRELDVLVAERMGWRWWTQNSGEWRCRCLRPPGWEPTPFRVEVFNARPADGTEPCGDNTGTPYDIPDYSTDWAGAGLVLEWCVAHHVSVSVEHMPVSIPPPHCAWSVRVSSSYYVFRDGMPHALCLAFLLGTQPV